MRLPLTLAFSMPDFTRALIMLNSNSEKTAINCRKATVIGSGSVVRQSIVMLPRIWSRMCLSRIVSTIPQNCWTDRDRRDGSVITTVSPGCTEFHIIACCTLTSAFPCSYSLQIREAPAARSSRTCRSMSCFVSFVEQRA